jgi:ethanolamine ammonia-lyase small subunit
VIDRKLVEQIVRESLAELSRDEEARAAIPQPFRGSLVPPAREAGPHSPPPHLPRVPPFDAKELEAIKAATPARLAQGRTGTRYLTSVYVGLRAEHAIALDAVAAEVPDELPAALGCIALRSRCKDRQEFLLQPDQGRRLDEASVKKLQAEGTRDPDVQIVCGDGLSAWALVENGPTLLPLLQQALAAEKYKLGTPLFVQFCRVGIQDEIGVLLGAKCTVILVGERPGLGTGDSLSIYTAYAPRLGQDNAEKDCISNVRPLGFKPEAAARECAAILRKTFAAGGGGIKLTASRP